jgi:DNA-binding NtrC family response regulator
MRCGGTRPQLFAAALKLLKVQPRPSNIRELQNVMERALGLSEEQGVVRPEHLLLASDRAVPLQSWRRVDGSYSLEAGQHKTVIRPRGDGANRLKLHLEAESRTSLPQPFRTLDLAPSRCRIQIREQRDEQPVRDGP